MLRSRKLAIWVGVTMLFGGMGVLLTADAQQPAPPAKGTKGPNPPGAPDARLPLEKQVANATKLKEQDVRTVINALGPAIRNKLQAGDTVSLPGVGTFRIVRIEAHRDLIKGVPGDVPAANVVEYLPDGGLAAGANAGNSLPAVSVPSNEFVVDPNRVQSTKVESIKTPRSRAGR
jgi:nucleoid DNA-binding protein